MKRHLGIRLRSTWIKRWLCMILIFIFSSFGMSEAAPGIPLKEKFKNDMHSSDVVKYEGSKYNEMSYSEVMQGYQEKGYQPVRNVSMDLKPENVTLPRENAAVLKSGIGEREKPVLIWKEDCEWIEWTVIIPQEGLYALSVDYYPLEGTGVDISRELEINGESPFSETHNITFSRIWQDDGSPKVNAAGDEVIPRQKEIRKWVSFDLTDSNGMYSMPFCFFFHEGMNTIRMNYINQPVAIAKVTVKSPDTISDYKSVRFGYDKKGYPKGKIIEFQAEGRGVVKSDPTVRLDTDGDPTVKPRSIENVKLNVMGGTRWQKGNQWITWSFDIPEDGLYKIALRVGQWWGDGLPSYRQIALDGKVPFQELAEYQFGYGSGWRTEVLRESSGEPFLFYLAEGTHELTMTVKMGPYGEIINSLTEDIVLLSDMILKITMITGESPDLNYDYDLHLKIPDLVDHLKKLSQSLQWKIGILQKLSDRRLPVVNNLESIQLQVDAMVKNPEGIPAHLSDLTEAQTSIGTWIDNLKQQPVILDYFLILSPDTVAASIKPNVFQKLYTTTRNFIASFYKDYDNVSSVYEEEVSESSNPKTIHVWAGMGREAAQLVKELSDSDFTPRTGIRIKMNVMPSSQLNAGSMGVLMLSIVSGKAPDVALGVSSDSPVEYAIRNAVKDLSEFKDFDSVYRRFLPGIMIPYEYQDGFYALPQTMGFNILFYRKDVMNELNLAVPDTWDEIRDVVLPVLYQNKMTFVAGEQGLTFGAFLLQNGGAYYRKNGMQTGLDTPEALKAFTEWTGLYTNYGVPVAANFFTRFRAGTSPIGIGGYDLYMKLLTAAPELLGKWGVALVPGTEKPDGTIDRSAVGGATGQASMILKQSEQQDAAWEFLKWWTNTESQVNFGREIEALLGPEARWNSANIEAFDGLPWIKEDIDVIKEQWTCNKEQPVVPGGYFTTRHLNNAFTRTVMNGENPRDSLEEAVEDINSELLAKQKEFGIDAKEKVLNQEKQESGFLVKGEVDRKTAGSEE